MKIFKTWCLLLILLIHCLTATELIIVLQDSSPDTIDIRAIGTGYFIGTSGWEPEPNRTFSDRFTLFQNYPNPFNNTTIIRFWLSTEGFARISITDLLGREVICLADRRFASGYHRLSFKTELLTSGTYLCTMETGGGRTSRIFTIIK
ncbi:MAG: T9SS type A sorting domain-containing protein [Fidelibacterota bacterium]